MTSKYSIVFHEAIVDCSFVDHVVCTLHLNAMTSVEIDHSGNAENTELTADIGQLSDCKERWTNIRQSKSRSKHEVKNDWSRDQG
jgi:hypothetical protein